VKRAPQAQHQADARDVLSRPNTQAAGHQHIQGRGTAYHVDRSCQDHTVQLPMQGFEEGHKACQGSRCFPVVDAVMCRSERSVWEVTAVYLMKES